MNDLFGEQLPTKLTAGDLHAKIKGTTYTVLPDAKTTICQITLENGFTVNGTSACVDPRNFNAAIGEKFAFEQAFEKIWELEGYLLRQKRFEASLP
jgi:hypothetical protein